MYEYQQSIGDEGVDKLRNGLIDDYNAIVAKPLYIYQKSSLPMSGSTPEKL